jgi:predicted lipoprotein with Yx(FWY)xxD motif
MKRWISHPTRPGLIGLLIIFSLLIAACSSTANANNAPATAMPGTEMPATGVPATGGQTVRIANNTQLGPILVTPDGKTLYTNTVDTPDHLRCVNSDCTAFWTPYTIQSQPAAGQGIPGSLGLITRPDGSKQVAYNQQPLYTFYLDNQPGEVKGNGFQDFGGTWHVVSLGNSSGSNGNNNNGSGGYKY